MSLLSSDKGGAQHPAPGPSRVSVVAALLLISATLCAVATAQLWRQSPVTVDPGQKASLPSSAARAVCAPSPHLAHAVYCAGGPIGTGAFYASTTDQGLTWTREAVSPAGAEAGYPAIDVPRSGTDEPHVVWIELHSGDRGKAWYRHPTGVSSLITAPGVVNATRPAVAVDESGQEVVVAWQSLESQTRSLRYRRSTDGGESWGPEQLLWQDPVSHLMTFPSLEFGAGCTLHVAWSHYDNGDIYFWYRRSLDAGVTWEDRRLLWSGSADEGDEIGDRGPVLAAGSTGRVDVVWVYFEMTDNTSLYAISSTDEGESWPAPEQAVRIAGPGAVTEPSVETDSRGYSYVFWQEQQGNDHMLFLSRSPYVAAGWLGPVKLGEYPRNRHTPRLAVDSRSTLHLLYLSRQGETSVLQSLWGPQLLSDREGATAFNQQRHVTSTPNSTSSSSHALGITYEDNGVIYYLRSQNTGGSWSLPETVDFGEYPALVPDEGGYPRIAYLKNGQDIMLAVREIWPEWNHYTVYKGNLPHIWPGPPAACYSAFPGGAVRVVYAVSERPDEFGPPTDNYIYLSEVVGGQVLPPEVLYSSAPGLCLTPSVAFTPEFPSDRLHVAWEAEGGVKYRTREAGVWSAVVAASSPMSEPAWSPALEPYGDQVYCVWRGPNEQQSEPGDVWRGMRVVDWPLWLWGRQNQSQSLGNASEYPVQSTNLATVWQEQVSGSNWDIWQRHEDLAPRPFYESQALSSFPHCAVDFHEGFCYYNVVWTEKLAELAYEARFSRQRQAIPEEEVALYSVAAGEAEASPYCLERDSTLVHRGARADYGRSRLRYRLPYLAPAGSYSAWARVVNPARAPTACTLAVDGRRMFEVLVPADSSLEGWFDLPARLYRDDGVVEVSLSSSQAGVALAGLAVCETARRPPGGGIQSASGSVRGTGTALRVGPSLARGQASFALTIVEPSRVRLCVYDKSGREVARMHDGAVLAGRHTWTWSGTDASGQPVPAGVYFARADADGVDATARFVLVR